MAEPMTTTLLDNILTNHVDVISQGLASAEHIFICTAFLKTSGLDRLHNSLKAALRNGASLKVIVGLDFCLTQPNALWKLFDLVSKNTTSNALLTLCDQDKAATFHPKLYCWLAGELAGIVIGSANLTGGGLGASTSKNIELSVLHVVSRNSSLVTDILDFFSSIQNRTPRCNPATALSLTRYEQKFHIYEAKRKEAEAAAEAAVKSFPLDPERLGHYLSEYLKDANELSNLVQKRLNYKKAVDLLTQLATSNIADEARFLKIYEQLVHGLWHSGGLYRTQKEVARYYERFIDMVKDLRGHKDDPVDKAFAVALQHAKQIDGLGLNITTEMLNTLAPAKFAVLNKNSAGSLVHLGCTNLGTLDKHTFSVQKYVRFNEIMTELASRWKFTDLSQVDHFLNYVYWHYVKQPTQP